MKQQRPQSRPHTARSGTPCRTPIRSFEEAGRAPCYNCEIPVRLEPAGRQWCPECNARLRPAPAWVEAAGWPARPVPSQERNRRTRRARIPVKAVRFDSPDGRSLAGTIEILAKRERLTRNELLLDLLRRGLQQHLNAPPKEGL